MEVKEAILSYLNSQKIMALSTYDHGLWSCNVYFVVDDDLSLYFSSSDKSKHIQQIHSNPNVAFSVYDSHQNFGDKKAGAQGIGKCTKLNDVHTAERISDLWNSKMSNGRKILDFYMNFGGLYKISPTEIKLMDEAIWGLDRYRTITF